MRCLNETTILRYIEEGFKEPQNKKIAEHIRQCPGCNAIEEALREERDYLRGELAILEPETIPVPSFIPSIEPRLQRKISRRWFVIPSMPRLQLAGAMITLLIAVFLFLILAQRDPGPGDTVIQPAAIVQAASIAGKPVDTFIMEEKETNTTFVWIESRVP